MQRYKNFREVPIKRKTDFVRSIAFISDLHVGSRYAVCPDKWQAPEGQWLIPSAGQVALNDSFGKFIEKCKELNVDTVLVNGDAMHGQNVMENGVGLSTSTMDEQIEMCVRVLRPLAKGRKLLMVGGSGYHKSVRGLNPEKMVCDSLGGIWLGPLANIQFSPSARVFNVHHGQSAAFIYREMLAGREILFSKWAQGSGRLPKFDVIVRGHLHSFMHIHENDIHYLQLPCWMAFEPSKITLKLYAKMTPDIGGIIVRIDREERIIPWHFLYPTPHIADPVRRF
jgi:hypothetical protein